MPHHGMGPGPGPGMGGRPMPDGMRGGGHRRPTAENPNAVPLSDENVEFLMQGGLLCMRQPKEAPPQRVQLHRNFPFEFPFAYLSVLDMDGYELATIQNLLDFSEATQALLRRELERFYYSPAILKIYSVKERFGFSYWDAETTDGRLKFTMQDTNRNMTRAGDGRLFLLDVDGNRFAIENLEALDRKSAKKIELYL